MACKAEERQKFPALQNEVFPGDVLSDNNARKLHVYFVDDR